MNTNPHEYKGMNTKRHEYKTKVDAKVDHRKYQKTQKWSK